VCNKIMTTVDMSHLIPELVSGPHEYLTVVDSQGLIIDEIIEKSIENRLLVVYVDSLDSFDKIRDDLWKFEKSDIEAVIYINIHNTSFDRFQEMVLTENLLGMPWAVPNISVNGGVCSTPHGDFCVNILG
jgi:hypothetical protein